MSIAGRNHHRGSAVHVYRKTDAVAAGGLTARTWDRQFSTRLAILTTTDAIARRIFGEETEIDATAAVPVTVDIRREDVVLVYDGEHRYRRFWVASARPLRRFLELGLSTTTDIVDPDIPEAA